MIGDEAHVDAPVSTLVIPFHGGWSGPAFRPGIFFGMPEETYHAVPALSSSALKTLLCSPPDFWWTCPWLRSDCEPKETTEAQGLGNGYHKRILEGSAAFGASFAPTLEKGDFGDELLVTLDDIKKRCEENGIKGVTSKKVGLEKLRAIGVECVYWEEALAEYAQALGEGVAQLPAGQIARIELAAAMIERHPELKDAFTGGYAEVSIFWICQETGVPMKARLDYLKLMAVVDLKSFSARGFAELDKQITKTIANWKYHLQPPVYLEAVDAAKAMWREQREGAAFEWIEGAPVPIGEASGKAWLDQWADPATPAPTWLWVFQKSGGAPVARGRVLDRYDTLYTMACGQVRQAKDVFRRHVEHFGNGPWVDHDPIRAFDSTEFPVWIAD